jgi:hypothetical protein
MTIARQSGSRTPVSLIVIPPPYPDFDTASRLNITCLTFG